MQAEIDALKSQLEEALTEIERQKGRRVEDRQSFDAAVTKLKDDFARQYALQHDSQGSVESEVANALLQLRGTLLNDARTRSTDQVIMTSSQNAIRDFNGTEDAEGSDAWIRELDLMKTLNQWSDATTYNVAKAHFKNAALKWFLTRMDTVTDYESLKRAFKSTFTKRLSKSDRLRIMSKRTQKKGETLQEYVLDKIWLCSCLNLSISETRDEVADGLWSKDIANLILTRDYTTTDGILQDILRFDKANSHRRERYGPKFGAYASSGKYKQRASATSENNSDGEDTKSLSASSEGEGHISKNCPQESKPIKSTVDTIQNVSLSRGALDEKFFQNVYVNDVCVKAEIDMGAEVNTMKSTFVLTLGLHVIQKRTILGGFGENDVRNRIIYSVILRAVRPKVVKRVQLSKATQTASERAYSDSTSFDAFPATSVYPTQEDDGNPLEIEYGLSTYQNHQTLTIQEMPEKAPAGQLPRTIEIILDNDLVHLCKPDDRVQVIGNYRCVPGNKGGYTSGAFSEMNNRKTKLKNKMSIDTMNAAIHTGQLVKMSGDDYEPSQDVIEQVARGRFYDNKYKDV
uniref:DNA replication licensing factor MCM3 n=1 Tax=Trichogramma kaykai TaxID=54128 RepID=A0ABD2WQ06_9HYME